MLKRNYLGYLILLSFVQAFSLSAQNLGGNPNLDWNVVKSKSVNVIYPVGMDAKAQRIAGLINYLDSNQRKSIGPLKKHLNLVLQNQTVIPNGYVSLAPFRSEFYSTPPSSNLLTGSLDWLDQLAIHEYRHALQFMNTKRGLIKFAYWLQGESIWNGLLALNIPNWYLEGDAVITETSLSNSGRGRSPFFTIEQRALAMADINYSYAKNRNLSYKNMVPDQYRLGYMMLTKLRNEKGNEISAQVLHRAASFRSVFYPYGRSLEKLTGYSTKKLYEASWKEAKENFAKQLAEKNLTPTLTITPKAKKVYTEYRFPSEIEGGGIIARKKSFNMTDALVLIKDGKEKKLTEMGIAFEPMIQQSKGWVVWTELRIDSRRRNKDFNDIVLYNIKSNKKIYFSEAGRFFSPSISPDGKKIAAIQITENQKNEVWIFNLESRMLIKKITTQQNYFLARTAWTEDGNSIISIAKNNSQLALVRISTEDSSMTTLTPWTYHTMDAPVVKNEKVYFNAGYSGIDNIYSTDVNGTKTIQQISSVPIGAFDPMPISDSKILFTEFNELGYVISEQKLSTEAMPLMPTINEPATMPIYKTLANDREGGNILDRNFNGHFKTETYNALFRGMKLHTWGVSPSVSNPGLRIKMTSLLGDAELEAGANMNRNEGNALSYDASLKIGRYYPEISIIAAQKKREIQYYENADSIALDSFSETSLGAEFSIPWAWLKGNYSTSLQPKLALSYRTLSQSLLADRAQSGSEFFISEIGLSFSSKKRKAFRNLESRLGIELEMNYIGTIQNMEANKTSLKSRIFLPGLAKNHHILLGGSYIQENLKNAYQFQDIFEYTRGFKAPLNDAFQLFKLEYLLPIAYPDKGIAGICYFKRIKANLFFDYGISSNYQKNSRVNYNSAGFEVIFDNVYLNVLPLSFGLRNSYLLTKDPANPKLKNNWSLFLSKSFD